MQESLSESSMAGLNIPHPPRDLRAAYLPESLIASPAAGPPEGDRSTGSRRTELIPSAEIIGTEVIQTGDGGSGGWFSRSC